MSKGNHPAADFYSGRSVPFHIQKCYAKKKETEDYKDEDEMKRM